MAETPEILVVEDDPHLRLALVDNLEDEGYVVDQVANGHEALEKSSERHFDVVVLDIMLPDIDGYTVCRRMREQGARSGILMLTARTLEDDLVAGFDAGADDYLAKPYRLRELLARVGALARRRGGSGQVREPPTSVDGMDDLSGIKIDRKGRTVRDLRGELVDLTRTEFDLLIFLLDHAGQALSRQTILRQVWGDVIVDPRTVDNFISSLKRKLGWKRGCGFGIHAVRGVGYRFERLD